MSGNELILLAPVSGVIYPLERVPDPVFSQKLAGDGISIDPVDNIPAGALCRRDRAAACCRSRGDIEDS